MFMSANQNNMTGQVVMVTGATDGIGQAVALILARQGAEIVGVGRNPHKCAYSTEMIKKSTSNQKVNYLLADLSSQQDIHHLAAEFKHKYNRLDVLVNNAGAAFARRQETVDGIEMTFALNHLNYFLLTNLLLEILKASAPSRIVNVSSRLHRQGVMDFDDLQFQHGYSRFKAYRRSKLANVLFTYELARHLQGTGVTVNAADPGLVKTNSGANDGLFTRLAKGLVDAIAAQTPEEGAQTIVYLAGSPNVEGITGKFFRSEQAIPSSDASYDQQDAQQLWQVSAQMTGMMVIE
jgi:NAD(P)-dependent dehydrogenase (short-subunit alcohol dehydrogenase family)